MELHSLWAAVQFTAQNGGTDALLSAAAASGLHLYEIIPLPGGFSARCAAWNYLPLAALARKRRVRLRICRRRGLFFCLRPLLHHAGLWAGLVVFIPLLLWSQGLIWAVDDSTLTPGQRARAAAVLRTEVGLMPGARVTEQSLTAGEYALLESGEFSWASLNFLDGRLTIETAAAKPVPEIFSAELKGIRARAEGLILRTNLISGTMLVKPGQQVQVGQGLIGTARRERDGTLIYEPAAGSVVAQFEWQISLDQPLHSSTPLLTGLRKTEHELSFLGHSFSLPHRVQSESRGEGIERHFQAEILGFPLPVSIRETTFYQTELQEIAYTPEGTLALARMHSLQALFADYPDAEILARKEDTAQGDETLHYTASYTITADICG